MGRQDARTLLYNIRSSVDGPFSLSFLLSFVIAALLLKLQLGTFENWCGRLHARLALVFFLLCSAGLVRPVVGQSTCLHAC
jgi:hypothetical protein